MISFKNCQKKIIKLNNIKDRKEFYKIATGWAALGEFLGIFHEDKEKVKNSIREYIIEKFPDTFLESSTWRILRYKSLKLSDGKCQLCGRSKHDGIKLNVDHIKPRKFFPEMSLNIDNLQVLCMDCNHGKGNTDKTDWRKKG
jgi:5-methylcytosine-specific restriction endonuclease McrA